jgi:putative hydrolase of the HAD superfamily
MSSSCDIKAILFDADGVTQLPGNFDQYAAEQYGWSEQQYQDFFRVLFWCESYKGSLTGDNDFVLVLARKLSEFNCSANAEQFMYEWFHRNIIINTDLWQHIERLRRNGLRCYVTSNQEKHRAHYMTSILGYASHFDGLYFSYELGALKPSTAYFDKIVESIQIQPSNLLFFDDFEDHVVSARSFGMNAEVYRSYSDYLETVKNYKLPR